MLAAAAAAGGDVLEEQGYVITCVGRVKVCQVKRYVGKNISIGGGSSWIRVNSLDTEFVICSVLAYMINKLGWIFDRSTRARNDQISSARTRTDKKEDDEVVAREKT